MSASSGLWIELGESMRALRVGTGTSLRQAEAASGRGRGTLSQVENAKARPGRELVEWYDSAFAGDGLLLSIYAEARGAHGPQRRDGPEPFSPVPGDRLRIEAALLAAGQLVRPGELIAAGWTVANLGTVPWHGRRLQRVGAHSAPRLLASAASIPVPDCGPGDRVQVRSVLEVPDVTGTFAAYWQFMDAAGHACYPPPTPFTVLVVAHD